jgi:hypothetical protein
VAYDPYIGKILDIIQFKGISHNPTMQVTAVVIDPYTGLISVVANGGAAFPTGGADVSGDNFIIKYDPVSKSTVWKLNITAVTNGKYGGFQGVTHDARGNTYVIGTYPGTIWRVDKAGSVVSAWYLPSTGNTMRSGYEGVTSVGDVMLVNNGTDGQLYSFNMTAAMGTPVQVPTMPNTTISAGEAIYLPPKYSATVLLAAMGRTGISVFQSKDASWKTADYLGTIAVLAAAEGAALTAAVQVGNSFFVLEEFFFDQTSTGSTAGNRTVFPMVDITKQVAALVGE